MSVKKMHLCLCQPDPAADMRRTARPKPARKPDATRNWLFVGWLAVAMLCCAQAGAQPGPKPVRELAQLTLIAGDANQSAPSETLLWAALDIKLAPKVKTYWRTVGDSGLPPVFNWTGSVNLQQIEVLWPAPIRFSDGTGTSIGYQDRVVLPLKVTPSDPLQPVVLNLSLDYAVCETLCMPAHFSGRLTLSPPKASQPKSGTPRLDMLALITAFQARVPVSVALSGPTPLAVLALKATQDSLIIDTRWPPGSASGDVFIEGPEGWAFKTPERLSQKTDAAGFVLTSYRVGIDERPAKDSPLAGVTLTATLVSSDMVIETRATLDKSGQAP